MKLPANFNKEDQMKEVSAILEARHADPFSFLGLHELSDSSVSLVRVFRPDVDGVSVIHNKTKTAAEKVDDAGFFCATIEGIGYGDSYSLEFTKGSDKWTEKDPFSFPPIIGEQDIYYFGEGTHRQLYKALGAHKKKVNKTEGMYFAVWAPNAKRVSVVGDFNQWDVRIHPLRKRPELGVWEIFLPAIDFGCHYKFEIAGDDGSIELKSDPFAFFSQNKEQTASITWDLDSYEWNDKKWLDKRKKADPWKEAMSIYEVHLGSWAKVPEEENRSLSYLELADRLVDHVSDLGFTHVEFMPITEYPYDPSWGYQVGGYFSPTSRFGNPNELKALVDAFHKAGIGVILDWVPAHFPKDSSGLSRFDGTCLFEHSDPMQGEHPDWGTLIFNYGRNEVTNFLIASALFWLKEYHIDGIRVDAVASMLYLDYGRKDGEWIPNSKGGRENLEAVEFLKKLNTACHAECPGVILMAEESTAWKGVTTPVEYDGLGFGFKWNMGWMNDYLGYIARDPVHRKHHHNEATFSLMYAWDENFILPLSHDEVVHGKGSLLNKMPGDDWQKFANLRLLYTWMYLHPGKKLLFQGSEIAMHREWDHDSSLDWHLLEEDSHQGIYQLIKDLNHFHNSYPQLHHDDFDPSGWQWLDSNASDDGIFAFMRLGPKHRPLICVLNVTPTPRDFRLGVPTNGPWYEIFNSDLNKYGGSDNKTATGKDADEDFSWQGFEKSILWKIPPLGAIILADRKTN